MMLPVSIGKSSSGQDFTVDFEQLPHLFISYTEEVQIRDFFSFLAAALSANKRNVKVHFALASSRKYWQEHLFNNYVLKYYYSSYNEFNKQINSKEQFMLALAREMRQRSAMLKIGKKGSSGKDAFSYLVIMLDDTFDIIISSKKSMAIIFLQLLLMGRELKMHVVAASGFTYRNVLKQLIQLNPLVKEKFKGLFESGHFQVAIPIGAELVMTAEDFLFFKSANALDYQRLYPLNEKGSLIYSVQSEAEIEMSL